MIREAIEYVLGIAEQGREIRLAKIHGQSVSKDAGGNLHIVKEPMPQALGLNSSTGIVDFIASEFTGTLGVIIEVDSPNSISVLGSLNSDQQRPVFATAKVDDIKIDAKWMEIDETIITLFTRTEKTDERDQLIEKLGKIDTNHGVKTEDDGISQQVTVKRGVSMRDQSTVKPIVKLKPYRTFRELQQPEVMYLIRLTQTDGKVMAMLKETCDPTWILEGKKAVKAALENGFKTAGMEIPVILI
jgi:hypothetical protein